LNGRKNVNIESENIWKEEFVAYFEIKSQAFIWRD
jgi:hypothetical protein